MYDEPTIYTSHRLVVAPGWVATGTWNLILEEPIRSREKVGISLETGDGSTTNERVQSLFFVSTGRTGTRFLKEFFNRVVPECAGYHEPKPAFKRRGYELVRRDHTLYEKLYFKLFREVRFRRSGQKYYVEANNCLFSAIPLIRECFPRSKVIHIIRDGRDTVQSYINARKRYYHGNESVLRPEHFDGDPYETQWNTMTPIERTAWFWLRCNEVIEASNPDYTVLFEDLFTPPHEPIYRILDFLPETDVSKDVIERSFRRKSHSSSMEFIPDWSEWPSTWKRQFRSICGDKMREYGYEINGQGS